MIKYIFWALALISIDVYSQKNSFEITEVENNSIELKSKVNDVHLKKFQWLADKQIDSLASLLHDDVFYIHSNG